MPSTHALTKITALADDDVLRIDLDPDNAAVAETVRGITAANLVGSGSVPANASKTQIQDLFDAASENNGRVYFNTPGTYEGNWTITGAMTIRATDGVVLKGVTSDAVVRNTGDFVNVIGGLKVDGNSISEFAWHHDGANNCKLDSLWLTGATSHGLYIQGRSLEDDPLGGSYYNQWNNLVSKSNTGSGVKIFGTETPAHRANANNFFGGQVSANTGNGFDLDNVAGTAIFGVSIEQNLGYQIKFTNCVSAALTMIGGWIEGNVSTTGGVNVDATTKMVQIYGTRINQDNEFSGAGINNSGNIFMVDSISGILTKWMETIGGAFRDCHLKTALNDQLQTAGANTLNARVSGDTEWRYQLANNGNIFLGPGSGVSDVNYGRGAGGDSILSSKEWAATTGVRVGGVSGPIWTSGSGTPESNVTGSPGDLYSDTGGGAGVTLYVKESGFIHNHRLDCKMNAFEIAQRFVGIKEVGGSVDNPQIMAMLKLDNDWPEADEVPWCSAFANYVCWLLRLPRSKNLRARSWLTIGKGIPLDDAEAGDVIVLKRGKGPQPGPEVLEAPGHVGFYAGRSGPFIEVLGGNQSDTVKISRYSVNKLLGVRRLT